MKMLFILCACVAAVAFCSENNQGKVVVIPRGITEWGGYRAVDGFSYTANNSELYMDSTEVTRQLWDSVFSWSLTNGYALSWDASHFSSKGEDYPMHGVTFFDALIWINARSEKEGLTPCYLTTNKVPYRRFDDGNVACSFQNTGFRLPTIEEWEFAAAGGARWGTTFPHGDTITQEEANFCLIEITADGKKRTLFHPKYHIGGEPFTSPVASFAPNGLGLYDMAGNVAEWCWDGFFDEKRGYRDSTLKGGSWCQDKKFLSIRYTQKFPSAGQESWGAQMTGFRCVRRKTVDGQRL